MRTRETDAIAFLGVGNGGEGGWALGHHAVSHGTCSSLGFAGEEAVYIVLGFGRWVVGRFFFFCFCFIHAVLKPFEGK